MRGEININTITVGDFNTPLTPMDRSTKQKIKKETQTLNDTMDQLDLLIMYRAFHSKTMEFNFFQSVHGTSSRIDHILGHKSSLGKFLKVETIYNIFSDHNAERLDVHSVQFSSVAQSCPTLCDPMNRTPGVHSDSHPSSP